MIGKASYLKNIVAFGKTAPTMGTYKLE